MFKYLKAQPVRRHTKDESSIVDFFVNTISSTIKRIMKPKKSNLGENETDKGLDVTLTNPIQENQVSFGNNQDLQLIYLGTKWCGSGDIAKNKRDIGYFYMTGKNCSVSLDVLFRSFYSRLMLPRSRSLSCCYRSTEF